MQIAYIKLILLNMLIFSFFVGCSFKSDIEKKEKIDMELLGAPGWVEAPQQENSLVSVAKATKGKIYNFRDQRDKAVDSANKKLNDITIKKVTSLFLYLNINEDVNVTKNDDVAKQEKEFITKAAIEVATKSMSKSKIIQLWKSKTESIYVLAALDLNRLKDEIHRSMNTTLKDSLTIYQNYVKAKTDGSLDILLLN